MFSNQAEVTCEWPLLQVELEVLPGEGGDLGRRRIQPQGILQDVLKEWSDTVTLLSRESQ